YSATPAFPGNSTGGSNYWVDVVFITTATQTGPVISNVQSSGVSTTGATITWTTDTSSDSQVEFGATAAYGAASPLNSTMVTSHTIVLSGLAAGTLYHYRVKSRDGSGTLSTSTDFSFNTSSGTGGGCPCSVWTSAAVPSQESTGDTNKVELGVRFKS